MTPDAFKRQLTVLCVRRRCLCQNMVVPEVALQSDHFRLVIRVTINVPDDDFIFVVAVKAAEVHLIHIHHAHIMAALDLVVDGNDLLSVAPPMILGVVVCGLDLKDRRFAVWQSDEVINVCQHIGIDRVIKHLLHLIDLKACFHMENLSYQILKQMPDLFLYPVAFAVLIRYDFELVVVEVTGGRKRGYT